MTAAGAVHVATWVVTAEHSAAVHGNAGFEVLATPVLVEFVEATAIACLSPDLEPHQGSVGVALTLKHSAPTLIGATVEVRVEVAEVQLPLYTFTVTVTDPSGPVMSGTHTRAVVDRAPFAARALRRSQA